MSFMDERREKSVFTLATTSNLFTIVCVCISDSFDRLKIANYEGNFEDYAKREKIDFLENVENFKKSRKTAIFMQFSMKNQLI